MGTLSRSTDWIPAECDQSIAGNYFVAAYPPFSQWRKESLPALSERLQRSADSSPFGIYVHIPFCGKKCDYCYYLSYDDKPASLIDSYIDLLVREFSMYAGQPALQNRKPDFVYFGGGTPSILVGRQVRRLGEGLQNSISWDGVKEVTFECAPKSVNRDLLDALKDIGVTRLSMGVQTFDDELLKTNGRIHLSKDVERALQLIKQYKFNWVNLDLMVGLIGETSDHVIESVQQAVSHQPDSVTVYQLEIPYNTKLYYNYKEGALPLDPIPWAEKGRRLDLAFQNLEDCGYTLVSGYNTVKDPQKHQFMYQRCLWRGSDMLGLGVASFSYFDGVHYQNSTTLQTWMEKVDAEEFPLSRAYALSQLEKFTREFVLQLKWGVVFPDEFQEKFGIDVLEEFKEPLQRLKEENLLHYDDQSIRLTRSGILQVDRLLPLFYQTEFQGIRYT